MLAARRFQSFIIHHLHQCLVTWMSNTYTNRHPSWYWHGPVPHLLELSSHIIKFKSGQPTGIQCWEAVSFAFLTETWSNPRLEKVVPVSDEGIDANSWRWFSQICSFRDNVPQDLESFDVFPTICSWKGSQIDTFPKISLTQFVMK